MSHDDPFIADFLYRHFNRRKGLAGGVLVGIVLIAVGVVEFRADRPVRSAALALIGLLLGLSCAQLWRIEPRAFRERLARQRQRPSPESRWIAVVHDDRVSVTDPDGATSSVLLSALSRVLISTTDSGPWVADYWLVLVADEGSAAIPLGATGWEPVLERLRTLPGWRLEAELAAVGSTTNAQFPCWERPA